LSELGAAFKEVNAHVWEREEHEHYVEPYWCSNRLFEEERFDGGIWDPCCGFGRIPDGAIMAGIGGIGTDLVDRGYRRLGGTIDFMKCDHIFAPNIVCNPPFDIAPAFAQRALMVPGKVAMIFPTARLNAAHWLRGTPLKRVWLMTPRPSMPPGHTIAAGKKPGGGKMDYCWLVWEHGHEGCAELRWLQRDAA